MLLIFFRHCRCLSPLIGATPVCHYFTRGRHAMLRCHALPPLRCRCHDAFSLMPPLSASDSAAEAAAPAAIAAPLCLLPHTIKRYAAYDAAMFRDARLFSPLMLLRRCFCCCCRRR